MTKQSGLGDNLYVDGFDISGDTNSLQTIGAPMTPIDMTGINVSAHERVYGRRDGKLDWTSYWNPGPAANAAHTVLSTLPYTDRITSYVRGPGIGNPMASMVGKQINYDGTRAQAGEYTFKLEALANGFGIEWGNQLTAGIRTDTAATNGASWQNPLGNLAFGAQAYLHVFGFTGTDATVTIQHSTDNATWATLLSFTQVVSAPGAQRAVISNTSTVNQWLRVITTTTGGFTSLQFAVQATVNPIAGEAF